MKKNNSIGIIGFGRFGTLAASVLQKHAQVLVYHYKKNKEDEKKAKIIGVELVDFKIAASADTVILAGPINVTEKIIQKASRYVKPGALVLDTCSVKTDPCRWLKKHIKDNDVEIIGTHPMFGPVTTKFNLEKQSWKLDGLQMVLCPLRIKDDRLKKTSRFLRSLGLKVIITTPENHDRQNAKTLSLVHFLGRVLNEAEVGRQEIFTPGYTDLLKIIPHTTSDNWQLFYDMNNYNQFADITRKKFLDSCRKIEEKIERSREKRNMGFHRGRIDSIDKEILALFAKRFAHVRTIGKIKKKEKLIVVDKKREQAIIERRIKQSGLDAEFIKDLYALIFKESYKRQK